MTSGTRVEGAADDGGFSLIELLIVMIIIGVLAAIAIPVFLNQRKKGYEASEKADLHALALQMETYFSDFSTYPSETSTPVSFTANNPANGGAVGTVVLGPRATGGTTISVSLSRGNLADEIVSGSKGFCISMGNSNSGTSAPRWYYDTLNGGITTTACSASSTSY